MSGNDETLKLSEAIREGHALVPDTCYSQYLDFDRKTGSARADVLGKAALAVDEGLRRQVIGIPHGLIPGERALASLQEKVWATLKTRFPALADGDAASDLNTELCIKNDDLEPIEEIAAWVAARGQ